MTAPRPKKRATKPGPLPSSIQRSADIDTATRWLAGNGLDVVKAKYLANLLWWVREEAYEKSASRLEELCVDERCPRTDTHWHPFSVADFEREKPGEYTVTLRVRKTGGSPR